MIGNSLQQTCKDWTPEQEDAASQKGVTICTIHASKGLEWDVVVVPRCTNDFLPNTWYPEKGQRLAVPEKYDCFQVLADFGGPKHTWRISPPVGPFLNAFSPPVTLCCVWRLLI